jgi:hypothetical protein
VPAALCLLLAWVQFADRIALLTAVLPLLVVCAVRTVRGTRSAARLSRLPISSRATNRDKATSCPNR